MNRYIQQKYQNKNLFGKSLSDIVDYDVFQEKFEGNNNMSVEFRRGVKGAVVKNNNFTNYPNEVKYHPFLFNRIVYN